MMAAPSLALLRIMAGRPGHHWTLMELQVASGMEAEELTAVLQWLRLQHLIRRNKAQCYMPSQAGLSLASQPAVTPPQAVTNNLRALIWRALRMQRKASASELLDVIGHAATKSALQSVREYLNALVKVGVVAVSRFKAENGERLYQLQRDLGPRAPAHEKGTRRLIDMNSGKLLEVADAAAA
jgi:Fe2+ or Zn2+ uptake regulation protein